jgi:hypothetical protein
VQYNQDATQVSTYWIKETITTTATLEVSKSGYETYSAEIDITKKQDMTIALKTAKAIIMDIDGNVYSNLDKTNINKKPGLLKL